MKCRPFAWLLWGLLPILALIGYTLYSEKTNIESDLTGRMQSKLDAQGLGWAKPSFEGRDGTLKGLTLQESKRVEAAGSVNDLYGVRILDDKTSLTPAIRPYVWNATTKDKTLHLKGYVPSTGTAASIKKNAKTLFPGYSIVDDTKLARGADEQSWTHQTNFAMTQLKNLKQGQASLSDADFSIQGRANSSQSYKFVKENIHNKLTSGLTLKEDKVLPPVISPYKWDLVHSGDTVTLDGYVPSEADRKALLARIKDQYPDSKIVDNTQIADGAPENWLETASLASEHAAKLQGGKANLTDKNAEISGTVPDYKTYDQITANYEKTALDSYTHSAKLTSLKPRTPTVSPYTMDLVHSNKTVTLDGYVPSEPARKTLLARIQKQYPGSTIVDNMKVAKGAPDGWLKSVTRASGHAAELQGGKASLSDKNAEISGTVPNYKAHDRITASYKKATLPGYTHTAKLTSLKPRTPTVSPYTLDLVHSNKTVTLDGYVPSEPARKTLLARIQKQYPGSTIVDNMKVAKGAPDGWLKSVIRASGHAAKLQGGKASLSDKNAEISGAVPNYKVHDQITASYKKAALPGYTHSSKLTSLKPRIPTASPFTWMAESKGDNLILRGFVPNENQRAALLKTAKSRFPGKTVSDQMVIAKGAPKGWLKTSKHGLAQLAKLDYGTSSLDDTNFSLTGFAKSEAIKAKVKPVAKNTGYASTLNITTPKPKPAPKVEPVVEAVVPTEDITGADSAKICENVIKSFLKKDKINFKSGNAVISAKSYGLLDNLANIIKRCPDNLVDIQGHTDSTGTKAGNKLLSAQRAEAVYNRLIANGIDKSRLSSQGLGQSTPIAPNNTPTNRAKNRRIEFKLRTK